MALKTHAAWSVTGPCPVCDHTTQPRSRDFRALQRWAHERAAVTVTRPGLSGLPAESLAGNASPSALAPTHTHTVSAALRAVPARLLQRCGRRFPSMLSSAQPCPPLPGSRLASFVLESRLASVCSAGPVLSSAPGSCQPGGSQRCLAHSTHPCPPSPSGQLCALPHSHLCPRSCQPWPVPLLLQSPRQPLCPAQPNGAASEGGELLMPSHYSGGSSSRSTVR